MNCHGGGTVSARAQCEIKHKKAPFRSVEFFRDECGPFSGTIQGASPPFSPLTGSVSQTEPPFHRLSLRFTE
eukprot:3882164-Rhodomonas_salina.1